MNPGQLRRPITIQYKAPVSPSKNSIGEDDYAWATFKETRARIRPMKGAEQVSAEAQESRVDTEILIRYAAGVTAGMRVLDGAVVYDIRTVIDFEERKREMTLQCTRGSSNG